MMSSTFSGLKDALLVGGEWFGIFSVGLVIGVLGVIRRNRSKFEWTVLKERRFVEKHGQIHELLTELRVTVRASRSMIFQFHNGGSFTDGSSIKRFSMTHESCDPSTMSMILDSQDVVLTRYTDLVTIMEQTPSKIIQTNTLPTCALRSCLEINNAEYFAVVRLKCSDNITPLGFLCCHWNSSDQLDAIEKEGIKQNALEDLIQDSAREINTHLVYKQDK